MSDIKNVSSSEAYVGDSLVNMVTGIGTLNDNRSYNMWITTRYNEQLLTALYTSNWLAKRITTLPADDAVKRWREITTPSIDPDNVQAFEETERRIGIRSACRIAQYWSRLYGGGGVFIAVEGDDNSMPLDPGKVRNKRVNCIPLSRNELTPVNESIIEDNSDKNFGLPELYAINNPVDEGNKYIHYTRFIRFDGVEAPRKVKAENSGWGLSVFDDELIKNIEACSSIIKSLDVGVGQSNVDIVSVPRLFERLANKQTAEQVRARFSEGNIITRTTGVMLLDKDEEYNRHELKSVGSTVETMGSFLQLPSAATGIPVTRLLGISPGGLNATGESDTDNYVSMIEGLQNGHIRSALEITDSMIATMLWGKMPEDWHYEFRSIYPSDKREDSEINNRRVTDVVNAVTSGIMPASLGARQLSEDGIFTAIGEEHVKMLEDLEELDDVVVDEPSVDEPPAPEATATAPTDARQSAETEQVQQQALNGAQVSSLLEIAQLVKSGAIEVSQAEAVLTTAFPLISIEAIKQIVNVEIEKKEQPPIKYIPPDTGKEVDQVDDGKA
jgi:uncharacterized protein